MKDVTLGDIARLANCSKNTVSLALRDSSRISTARRQEIDGIARSLGYVPNLSARNLSARRSGYIGIYTRALSDAVRVTLVNNLITGFHGTGLHPILGLGDSPDQSWQESSWIQAFRAMRVEAIVLVAESHEQPLKRRATAVPTVLVHCQPDGKLQCDYVGLDRTEAARIGRIHLFSIGRRSIVVFGSTGHGFTESCRSPRGLPNEYLNNCRTEVYTVPVSSQREMAAGYLAYYLRRRKSFDAALFQDSGVAADFINKAVASGVAIPRELSVISYDYYPQADLMKVGLSTIEQPLTELSNRAIKMILSRVQNLNSPPAHEVLPHRLVLREST